VTNFSSFAHMYFRDDYWSWTCHTLPWKFKNIQWISQYPSIFILPSVYKVCSLSVCITFYTTKLIELKKFSVLFFVCLFVCFLQGGCCICVCVVFHLRNGEFSFCFCFTTSFLRRFWNLLPHEIVNQEGENEGKSRYPFSMNLFTMYVN